MIKWRFYSLFAKFSFGLLLLANHSHAQYTHLDSLNFISIINKADGFANKLMYDSAAVYIGKANAFCRQKKMLFGEGYSHLKFADLLYQQEKTVSLFYHDSMALKIGQQLKDLHLESRASYQMGQYYLLLQKNQEALNWFNKSLSIKFEKEQSPVTAVIYNDIGYTYGAMGIVDKQIEWLMKAVRLYEYNGDKSGFAQTLSNLSSAYCELKKYPESISYARQAIALREGLNDIGGLCISYTNITQVYIFADSLDAAINYQKLANKYAELTGIKFRMAQCYSATSLLLNRQGKNEEALVYEKKAIAIFEQLNDERSLSRRYIGVAILTNAVGDSASAIEYFNKAYVLSSKFNNKYNLRDIFLNQTILYKERKDFYNAYENYKKYIRYKDSIIKDETALNIAEIETKYQTEKKDNEINRLQIDEKIRQLVIEKQKAVIAGNLLVAKQKESEILVLWQQRELQDARLKQQGEELEKQMLIATNNQQKLKLAEQNKLLNEKELLVQKQLRNFIIAGSLLLFLVIAFIFNRFKYKRKLEQQQALIYVRNNIARDLHDEIGSTLTSIKILSEISRKNLDQDKGKAENYLMQIKEQSEQMQQGMSDIVWAIKPDNDKLENILVRMREYAAYALEAKNVAVSFSVDEPLLKENLSMEQRNELFLIFKEAINNAAKYAQASHVNISLSKTGNKIILTILDDGRGFETTRALHSNGLTNIASRAAILKGTADIVSEPGKGTLITVLFPAT